MQLTVKAPFSWAHRGVDIQSYAEGDVIETEDQDMINVATKEGWVEGKKAAKPADNKAKPQAPENK